MDTFASMPAFLSKWCAKLPAWLPACIPACYPACLHCHDTGKQRDDEDPRTKSLLHLLELLSIMPKPPSYIMLENVSGFHTSRTRDRLLSALKSRDYQVREVMLSPCDIGVPNSRLRYYLIVRFNSSALVVKQGDISLSLNNIV